MTNEVWISLLLRLEKDLQARRNADASGLDNDAWSVTSTLVRQYVTILSARAHLNFDEIDETTQEVLMKLQDPGTLRRLRLARSPAGYIAVMIRNRVIDHVRRQQKAFVEVPLSEDLVALQENPLEIEEDKTARLRAAVRSLPFEDRTLLRMRFWRDLSIKQIAERTGLTYSAVAVRLFRILRRLRERLETGT